MPAVDSPRAPPPGDRPSVMWAVGAATAALLVPTALSMSSTPSPNHPRIMAWYVLLRKPAFKPPDWIIPVAWGAIETALATAAYRLVRAPASAARSRALGLLGWNVVMIGGWSRLFFKRQNLAVSTAVAATMVVTGTAFVRQARQVDPTSARAGLPFVAWVPFATVLTATIWALNKRR